MKNQFLIFVNVLFSIFALKSVNGQLRRRASNNDSNININSNSNENIGSIDPCKGLCKNGSTCMEGIAQSPSKFRSSVGYGDGDDRAYHCECPYGWTGVRCDIVYESCSLESSPSESTPHYQHECYNNGKCVPGKFDDYGHEQLFCDCSDAFDEDGNMYAGKYCEHQVVDYCSDEENFCLNGAICNKDYPEFGGPCMCRGDFEGLHCESRKNSVPKSAQIIMQNAPNLAPQCDLTCLNGGYCVMHTSVRIEDGESEGNNLNTDVIDRISKYCACATGYDGPTCEIEKEEEEHGQESKEEYEEEYKQKFEKDYIKEEEECTGNNCEKNNKEIKACGSGHCYNGGTCVKSSIFSGNDNDDGQVYCDCSTATTNEVSYAGRSCQYEATSYCSDDSRLHGHLFCVNGGVCKDNIYKGCDCQDGFGGFSCEFTTSKTYESRITTTPVDDNKKSVLVPPVVDDPAYIKCDNSKCMNGGICRKGAKQHGSEKMSKIVRDIDHLDATYDPKNFDHCVCRPGFTGLRCEHEMEICNGDGGDINAEEEKHFCLHGSKCIKVTDNDNLQQQHDCDCSTTTSNISPVFAGKSCEHKSTSICTKAGEILPGKPLSFCVNGGSCLKEVSNNESHAGCECPANWSGPHCELHNDDSNNKDETIEIEPAAETTVILKSSLSEKQDEYDAFSSPSGSSNLKFRILSRFFIVVGSLVLVLMMIAYINKRQQRRKCAKEMKSFLTNNNSNSAHFTDNPLLQTPDNSINLAPKQDYNYDGIPLRPPSVTAIANTHYQPDPVDMIIDSMGKGKGIGMESSDFTPETNQYSTGRNKRGENNNHQIL